MTKQNDFHNALKQLSKDIRVLIDLSLHETDESWEKMIEIVKKEIVDEMHSPGGEKEGTGDILHQALISEIYDHLGMLIRSMKASQERLRKLATRDLLTGLLTGIFLTNRSYWTFERLKGGMRSFR